MVLQIGFGIWCHECSTSWKTCKIITKNCKICYKLINLTVLQQILKSMEELIDSLQIHVLYIICDDIYIFYEIVEGPDNGFYMFSHFFLESLQSCTCNCLFLDIRESVY